MNFASFHCGKKPFIFDSSLKSFSDNFCSQKMLRQPLKNVFRMRASPFLSSD